MVIVIVTVLCVCVARLACRHFRPGRLSPGSGAHLLTASRLGVMADVSGECALSDSQSPEQGRQCSSRLWAKVPLLSAPCPTLVRALAVCQFPHLRGSRHRHMKQEGAECGAVFTQVDLLVTAVPSRDTWPSRALFAGLPPCPVQPDLWVTGLENSLDSQGCLTGKGRAQGQAAVSACSLLLFLWLCCPLQEGFCPR